MPPPGTRLPQTVPGHLAGLDPARQASYWDQPAVSATVVEITGGSAIERDVARLMVGLAGATASDGSNTPGRPPSASTERRRAVVDLTDPRQMSHSRRSGEPLPGPKLLSNLIRGAWRTWCALDPQAASTPLPDPLRAIAEALGAIGHSKTARPDAPSIVLAGLGAVGSWTGVGLGLGLASGFSGELVVCDPDHIAALDLPRNPLAAWVSQPVGRSKVSLTRRALGRLRPGLSVRAVAGAVQTELVAADFLGAAVVIAATDNRASRLDLTHRAAKAKVPVVEAGLYADCLHLAVFDPPRGPCYEETLTERDWERIAKQYSCRGLWQASAGAAPGSLGPIAALAGLALAGLAVLALHGQRPAPRMVHVVGRTGRSIVSLPAAVSKRPCATCATLGAWSSPVPIRLSARPTVGDLLLGVRATLADANLAGCVFELRLPRAFVREAHCGACGHVSHFVGPAEEERLAPCRCGARPTDVVVADTVESESIGGAVGDLPIARIGLRHGDVVDLRVEGHGRGSTPLLIVSA